MAERPGILLAIAAGSALGALSRVALTVPPTTGFPWSLLLVNVIGSFLIAFYHELTRPGGRLYHRPVLRQFVMSGLLGGFTSYSLVALDSLLLALESRALAVLAFLLLSGSSWIVAAFVGRTLARRLLYGSGARG